MTSTKRFIADLHLGHINKEGKGIVDFSSKWRGGVKTIQEHDQWIIDQWNSVVKKQDHTTILGDVALSPDGLALVKKLHGTKTLLRGNHDKWSLPKYLKVFNNVIGFKKIENKTTGNRFWLSHAPIHPMSLRGIRNMHGHCHQHRVQITDSVDTGIGEMFETIDDTRYVNISVEQLEGIPRTLDELEEMFPY